VELIVFWLLFSFVIGIIASSKGRSGFGWFLLSVLISPLLSFILVLALPSLSTRLRTESGEPVTPQTHVRCPDCRELVRVDANKCRFCGCKLIPQA
jgi:hypothetical protein